MSRLNSNLFAWFQRGRQGWPALLLTLSLLILLPLPAVAESENELCRTVLEKEAYSDYLRSIDSERVKQTQRALNRIAVVLQLPVGEVAVDGVFGSGTREALYQYCRQLTAVPDEELIVNLVVRLDQQAGLKPTADDRESERAAAKQTSTALSAVASVDAAVNTAAPVVGLALQSGPGVWYLLDKASLADVVEKETPEQPLKREGNEEEGQQESSPVTASAPAVVLPPDDKLEKLERLFEIPYVNRNQFIQAVAVKAEISREEYADFIEALADAARKEASSKLTPIIISDNGCGCVRDFSSTVYGFYPYWRSTATRPDMDDKVPAAIAEQKQEIDYSVVNRIAYYGLTLSETGEINAPLHWSASGKLGNFINKAHRHKTAVDLALYSDHWAEWTESTMQASVMSVYNQLMLQVEYQQQGIKGYVPFLNSTVASPDGVTLHFDRFSDNPSARYKIVEFISQLYERLDDLERDYKINILLDIGLSELKGEEPLLKDIKSLLVSSSSGLPAYVNSLLVLIDEPTTLTKKLLRSKIEDEFSGAQRMEVLRKVIPVISPYGHEDDAPGPYSQFDDDLIYFQNNFSGVGLWPLPLVSDKNMAEISKRLITLYGAGEVDGVLNTLSDRYPALCEFACPNRWAFRLAIDFLLLLAIGYGVLALFSRRLRAFYSRHSLFFIFYLVAMVMIFLVSLTCDPFWKQKRDIVFLGLLLMASAIFVVRKYMRAKQGPLP